jgi:hypothetical protein
MNPTAFINLVEGASNAGCDYPDSMGRDVITRKWAEAVKDSLAQDGTQYSGEVGMLGTRIDQWLDLNLPSQGDAWDYICDHHQKHKPALAVSYVRNGAKTWLIGGWCSS